MNTFDDEKKASSLKLAFFMVLFLSLCVFLVSSCKFNVINESSGSYLFDQKIILSGREFDIVVLDTPQARSQGLMGVTRLAQHQGALFVYPSETDVTFWMKNTPLALDMLFFDGNSRLIKLLSDVPSCQQSVCPRYSSTKTRYVLELNASTAKALNIRLGDVFVLQNPL